MLRESGRRHVRVIEHPEQVGGASHVVETVADPELLAGVIEVMPRGGVLCLKSRGWGRPAVPLDRVVERELVLRGACYGRRDEAVRLIGRLDLAGLVGPSFALGDWKAAFEAGRADESTKVFLLPGGA